MNQMVRKAIIIAVLLGAWEIAARAVNTPLILPGVIDTFSALFDSIRGGDQSILLYVKETFKALSMGFGLGAVIAVVLTVLAVNTKLGEELFSTVTSGFAPLPAVAVSPIFMLIWGISFTTIVATAAFAATFPLAVNMLTGFRAVSQTLRNVGRNFGMSTLGVTCRILIPAALPSLISGARNAASNGIRALVALEMILGSVSGTGGVGFFLMQNKQNLEIPAMYAGVLAIMLIGLAFDIAFNLVERATVRKWGMVH